MFSFDPSILSSLFKLYSGLALSVLHLRASSSRDRATRRGDVPDKSSITTTSARAPASRDEGDE